MLAYKGLIAAGRGDVPLVQLRLAVRALRTPQDRHGGDGDERDGEPW
jgi:hypothetical protein